MDINPKVSIIIINWNGVVDTLECLESLTKLRYNNYEVIVVDNNSSGNDVEVIKREYGNFIKRIIINNNNLGFSGGNNIGINYAVKNNTDFILLLNNDTIVEENFLYELIETAISVPNAGLVGPLIGYYTDKEKIWSAYGFISKIRSSGFSKKINSKIDSVNDSKQCKFLSGCCLLIRKELIDKVGLLDENYFLYLEDTDLCWRASVAGYKIIFTAKSKIYHKVNISTKRNNPLLPLYYVIRNRLYFAKKNIGLFYYFAFCYIVLSMKLKIIFTDQREQKRLILTQALADFKNKAMGQKKDL
jgi:hypothetical protein